MDQSRISSTAENATMIGTNVSGEEAMDPLITHNSEIETSDEDNIISRIRRRVTVERRKVRHRREDIHIV